MQRIQAAGSDSQNRTRPVSGVNSDGWKLYNLFDIRMIFEGQETWNAPWILNYSKKKLW